MYRYIFLCIWILSISIPYPSFSQSFRDLPSGMPLKEQNEVMFGKDIIIHDVVDQDQKNVTICAASNGWLFCAYSYYKSDGFYITLLKSIDNGYSWTILADEVYTSTLHYVLTKITLTTSGNSNSNLKLFLGVLCKDTILDYGSAWVGRYKVDPFIGEASVLNPFHPFNDLTLANDFSLAAVGSYPNSYCALGSSKGTLDSIVLYTSSDGLSLNGEQVIAVSNDIFHKVSVAFGSSSSFNSGRYFVAWEEFPDLLSSMGHIYFSHSEPNFNSQFITPVCLDSIDPNDIGKCRNPIIACQYGNYDNDSNNLTTFIIYEKYDDLTSSFLLKGYYNLQSTTSNLFIPVSFPDSISRNQQHSISYNTNDSTFILTYFDSTNQNLPLVSINFNFSSPSQWHFISSGYNDNLVTSTSFPRVIINPLEYSGVSVWNAQRSNGLGISMLDAEYSTYTSIKNNMKSEDIKNVIIVPNPCSGTTKIQFEAVNQVLSTLKLYTLYGELLKVYKISVSSPGYYTEEINIQNFPQGMYIFVIEGGSNLISGKIIVNK